MLLSKAVNQLKPQKETKQFLAESLGQVSKEAVLTSNIEKYIQVINLEAELQKVTSKYKPKSNKKLDLVYREIFNPLTDDKE